MNPAKFVFLALNKETYETEEQARTASTAYLIRCKAVKLLAPEQSGWGSQSNYEKRQRVMWFLNNRERILAAYQEALQYAEEKMLCLTSGNSSL